MRPYLKVLSTRDFRRLWLGATASLIGDGMTFVALAWLALNQPHGTARLGQLAVCYTAPVVVGGFAAGWLLDRFDKRAVLATDSLLRAAAVASVPVTAVFTSPPFWLLLAVAAVYGLGKMIPLAGVPSAVPDLVGPEDLDAASALESLGFGAAGIVGPALAGLLITLFGAADVLAVDAVSFALFAAAAVSIRTRLAPPAAAQAPGAAAPARLGSVLKDPVLITTTAAFMAFNIAEGMLLVIGPWLARTRLPGGAQSLGLLLAALSAGELAGAAVAGSVRPAQSRLRAIGTVQILAACSFLAVLLEPRRFAVAAGFFALGAFSAPMTVWAQSLRMERIPAGLRGRAFALLRTLMQATPPVGAALGALLVAGGSLLPAALAMTAIAGLPAVAVLTARERSTGQD